MERLDRKGSYWTSPIEWREPCFGGLRVAPHGKRTFDLAFSSLRPRPCFKMHNLLVFECLGSSNLSRRSTRSCEQRGVDPEISCEAACSARRPCGSLYWAGTYATTWFASRS